MCVYACVLVCVCVSVSVCACVNNDGYVEICVSGFIYVLSDK